MAQLSAGWSSIHLEGGGYIAQRSDILTVLFGEGGISPGAGRSPILVWGGGTQRNVIF